MIINKKNSVYALVFLLLASVTYLTFAIPSATSQTSNVCCERTNEGAWCQNTLADNCDAAYSSTPSSCEATSFCNLGTCYDSTEGVCLEKTSQLACQESGGVWNDAEPEEIPQCQAGCCVLGGQAAYTTLTRCKKLSSDYNLNTDFRKNIGSEVECIAVTQAQDEGACVYESEEFITTCSFTTRSLCSQVSGASFHKDFLCSSEELATNCGPTTQTTCLTSEDSVYFLDSCGNPANIYDATRVNDKTYWDKIIPKSESCNPNDPEGNANNPNCGTCDYSSGSICKNYQVASSGVKPTYGVNICQDLDCASTFDGNNYKHGESWCQTDTGADVSQGEIENAVGSRYYRHICIAGEEIVEPCADFRQEICIESSIETSAGSFSQAGCRVNRWQDCIGQKGKGACTDEDKRDCQWIGDSFEKGGKCVPKVSPGLDFWNENKESDKICRAATETCVVKFESDLLGCDKCVENCHCLDDKWLDERKSMCRALGDCGDKVNVIKVKGRKGFSITGK